MKGVWKVVKGGKKKKKVVFQQMNKQSIKLMLKMYLIIYMGKKSQNTAIIPKCKN